MLPYPLFGVVPDYKKITQKKQLLLPDSSTANLPKLAATNISVLPIREAYHNIQINLKLLDNEVINKVIVVTSAVLGEGKSSVAANLAIAKAQCGQKVLLIDGDLRRPTQDYLWELSNNLGLTNILNQEIECYDTVQQVMPNLDVMTSGTTPQHPISLLNSPLMEALIARVSGHYDSVILDTPPLVGLADSKILSKLADGVLFVARPGVAHYGRVTAAKKVLETTDLNLLGVVANGVDFDKESYGYEAYYPDKKYLQAG
jgi:capsular exopolysaccharide synthesis family protein